MYFGTAELIQICFSGDGDKNDDEDDDDEEDDAVISEIRFVPEDSSSCKITDNVT